MAVEPSSALRDSGIPDTEPETRPEFSATKPADASTRIEAPTPVRDYDIKVLGKTALSHYPCAPRRGKCVVVMWPPPMVATFNW
jgi:hypothetical protein